jgi:hypothetical protein
VIFAPESGIPGLVSGVPGENPFCAPFDTDSSKTAPEAGRESRAKRTIE